MRTHPFRIALVVAARHTNILGITTVAGNAPLESTTQNAIVVRDLLGIDAPVHAGANRPLIAPAREPRRDRVHHRDGPQQRRCVAGAHRPADQHRAGIALGA